MAFCIDTTKIVFERLDVQYNDDYFITNQISIILNNRYFSFFPLGPHKKKKKKNTQVIAPPNILFSKIRIKTLELAFKTLGICHIYIFK
jgi:hypothetical protein